MLLRAGVAAVGGTAVLATVVGWQVSRADSDCSDATLTLAAADEIAPAIEDVLEENDGEISTPQGCAQVELVWMDPVQAVQAISSGQKAPDLWVPDTSAWLSRLPADLQERRNWQLAKTPVVLAGPRGAERPATWLEALSARDATLLDPRSSGAGVGALAALQAEATYGKTTGTDLSAWLVEKAQSAPDYSLDDHDLLTNAAGGGADSGWFPTTEQRFIERAEDGGLDSLSAFTPKSGSVLLDYPLMPVGTENTGLATAAAEELASRLASSSGQKRLAEAGFRPASAEPTESSAGVGRITEIGVVQPLAVGNMLHTWVTLSTDSRMLVVLDVSGSMEEFAGSDTRVALARDAALAALSTMPSRWEVGLWAFSVGLGNGDRDYRDLAPVRELGASSGASTHQDVLARAARKLPSLVGGGTALYDTALAAYEDAIAGYDKGRLNTVVLMTDGRNEDPNGLRLPRLLDELERRHDEQRPVQMITIGMGPQADTGALQQIADVTGGQSYVAGDPRDIEEIFNDALLERVGWGLR
jgi:Bacterial extracellular solute-binding protein/von Willebrand factor type A domain